MKRLGMSGRGGTDSEIKQQPLIQNYYKKNIFWFIYSPLTVVLERGEAMLVSRACLAAAAPFYMERWSWTDGS